VLWGWVGEGGVFTKRPWSILIEAQASAGIPGLDACCALECGGVGGVLSEAGCCAVLLLSAAELRTSVTLAMRAWLMQCLSKPLEGLMQCAMRVWRWMAVMTSTALNVQLTL
jgi:hypothetical protein